MYEKLNPKHLAYGSSVIVGSLILAGCANGLVKARENLSNAAASRIDLDYGGGSYMADGDWQEGQNCLSNTAYDPNGRNNPALVSISRDSSGEVVATVHPAGNSGSKYLLRLMGLNNPHRPLQPVDSQSREILTSYDCDTTVVSK